jgi:squamous cell carcinoma antigen recognized by T-cells 3
MLLRREREKVGDLGECYFLPKIRLLLINFHVLSYAELASEEDVKKALNMDRRMLAGRPVFISRCVRDKTNRESGFKYATSLEPNKLFVAFEATADDLRKLFGQFGSIKDVRLVTMK